MISLLGAGWLREDFEWEEVEPKDDEWIWTDTDELFQDAAERGPRVHEGWVHWAEAMVEAEPMIGKYIDGIAIHPYPESNDPEGDELRLLDPLGGRNHRGPGLDPAQRIDR